MKKIALSKSPSKCRTLFCRYPRIQKRTVCYRCRGVWFRETHPLRYAFNALRNNARRRGKVFTLTFDQFRDFCEKNFYMEHKGTTSKSLHIDRIDPERGYEADNIQVLTAEDNIRKHFHDKERQHSSDTGSTGDREDDIPTDDAGETGGTGNPF